MKKFNLTIKKHKVLLVGLIMSILLIYAGELIIKPLNIRLVNGKSEIEKLNIEKGNLLREVEQIKTKENEIKEKERHLNEYFILKSKLASLSNPSVFYRDITDFNKVKINSIRPIKKEKISHYIKMEINLGISGSYENIYNYFKYLDNLPYIISIKKLDFSKGEEKNYNNINLIIETVGR